MSSVTTETWYLVKNSSIHNRGVFAASDIPAGTRIIEYLGEKISKAESDRRGMAHFRESSKTGDGAVYLFILNKKFDLDGNVEWNTARLINHSCAPNCEASIIRGRIWIVALNEIPAGGELLFNYGFDLESWQDHPCRCGAGRCVGFIAAEEYWPKLRKLVKDRDAAIAEMTGGHVVKKSRKVVNKAGKKSLKARR